MKIVLLYLAIFLFPACLFSQESLDPIAEYEYAQIVGNQRFQSSHVYVHVEYGRGVSQGRKYDAVDEEGVDMEFDTMVDALYYMTALGWEFVQAYAVTSDRKMHHYFIIKRPLGPEKEK